MKLFQIWSVAPNSARDEFATAGGDGKMVIWKDVTEEKIEEENRKRRKQVEQEQVGFGKSERKIMQISSEG